jgi:membrane protease YdiL (CAAX protease family)
MANWAAAAGFLAAAAAVSLAWGRIMWYCNERSEVFRRWLFFAMSFTHARPPAVQSLLLCATYYAFGLLAATLFVAAFRVPVALLFSWAGVSSPLVVLGVVAEISLAGLLVGIGCRISTQWGPERLAEQVPEIPWIKGIKQFPRVAVPVVAAMGGVAEELFFRGVVLTAMIHRFHVNAAVAIAIAAALFCTQQVLQVRTSLQALLMICSCLSISLIGGLLVVLTGTVIPSILCHASFAVFFVGRGSNTDVSARREHRTARAAQ